MESVAHGHDFAAILVEMVVRKLNASPELLEQALEIAGEQRPIAEMCDPAGWSTYAQFRALLEATRDVLGGDEALAGRADVVASPTMPEIHALMLSLGNPD